MSAAHPPPSPLPLPAPSPQVAPVPHLHAAREDDVELLRPRGVLPESPLPVDHLARAELLHTETLAEIQRGMLREVPEEGKVTQEAGDGLAHGLRAVAGFGAHEDALGGKSGKQRRGVAGARNE